MNQIDVFECPHCKNKTFILTTKETICLVKNKDVGGMDVAFPEDGKELLDFNLVCENCVKIINCTDEMVEAIDFYIS
jgi:hypothetical protein